MQSLRSGDSVLAVSSWDSAEEMQRYLEHPATSDFYAALPELLMGVPSIRTYEVIRPAGDAQEQPQPDWGSA